MAIRTWHPGKLALIWLVCVIVAVPLFGWVFESHLIIMPPESSAEYKPFVENLRQEQHYKLIALLAAICLSGLPLVITWMWLSGREKSPAPSSGAPNA